MSVDASDDTTAPLDTIDGLNFILWKWPNPTADTTEFPVGRLFCSGCGDYRKMFIFKHHVPIDKAGQPRLPSLLEYRCPQCSMAFTTLLYAGSNGPAVVVLPSRVGGIATPHAPAAVAYYIDQACAAAAVNAFSASVAMYRAALEHLLFEQGYEAGMLNAKIQALVADMASNKAPHWAQNFEPRFLDVIKELGNAAIHTNGGDITKQFSLDRALADQLQDVFLMVLFLVYEVPYRRGQLLGSLNAKVAMLKK